MAIQIPVVLVQVTDVMITHGSDSIAGVDEVTGLLGEGAPGTLTEVGILVGLVAISAGYLEVISRRTAYGLGFAFLLIGALTSTRSAYVFDPVALAAIALLLWLAARTIVDRNTRRLATALPVLVLVVLIPVTGLLYPGANDPFESREAVQATVATGDSGGEEQSSDGSVYVAPTTILPGRSAQLELAFELTTEEDAATAVLGNGVGSTRFKEQSLLDDTGTTTDPITRDEQQVNGIWFPRVLTETGILGAIAFALLIVFICVLAWRNRAAIAARTGDGALDSRATGDRRAHPAGSVLQHRARDPAVRQHLLAATRFGHRNRCRAPRGRAHRHPDVRCLSRPRSPYSHPAPRSSR